MLPLYKAKRFNAMWGGLPCIYMRILWKEVFNPIHFKTLFV